MKRKRRAALMGHNLITTQLFSIFLRNQFHNLNSHEPHLFYTESNKQKVINLSLKLSLKL